MKSYTEDRLHFDNRIVEYIEGRGLKVNGIYQDIQRKREFLRDILGYNGLRVGKNQFAPLNECNDERISVVVKGIYSSVKKRLEKHRREQTVLNRTSGRSLEETVQSADF